MEAKNLRIGNYVTWIDEDDPSNAVLTLVGIYLNDAIWVEWTWGDGSNDNTDCDLETIKGIPITEEWLNKFGFEKKKGSISYDKDKLSLYFGDTILSDKNGRTYWNSWAIMEKTPNYIHELQNLFFAINGSELESKHFVTYPN